MRECPYYGSTKKVNAQGYDGDNEVIEVDTCGLCLTRTCIHRATPDDCSHYQCHRAEAWKTMAGRLAEAGRKVEGRARHFHEHEDSGDYFGLLGALAALLEVLAAHEALKKKDGAEGKAARK